LSRNKGGHIRTSSRGSIFPVSSNKSAKVPSTPTPTPSPPAPSEPKEKNYMDMFSPVKDSIEDSTINDIKTTSKNTTNTQLPVVGDILSSGIIDDLKSRIVTKVGETISEVRKSSTFGNEDSVSPVLPDTTSPKKRVAFMNHESNNNNDSNTITNGNDSTTTVSAINSKINHTNHNGTTITNKNSTISRINRNETAIANENIDTTTSNDDSNINHKNHNGTTIVNEKSIDTSTSNSNYNTTSTATNFQLQVIGSVVDECLQDFRISLRNDIQNMHLELLRQFHIQKVFLFYFILFFLYNCIYKNAYILFFRRKWK
jgi:hypothetical protein